MSEVPSMKMSEKESTRTSPSSSSDTKKALDTLKEEHQFSSLLRVVKELIRSYDQDRYIQTLRAGEILFDRGEDKHIYILTAGELAIQVQSRSGYKNVAKVQAINTLWEGTIFGRSFKPVRAIALSDISAIKLSDTDLRMFEESHPELMHRFYRLTMEKMNHHLREANHQLSEYESLIDHLSQYLQNESSGLLEMLLYLRDTFLLERVKLVEYHPLITGLKVVRYDSLIRSDELIYQADKEDQSMSAQQYLNMSYELKIADTALGTLLISSDPEDPLDPKDEQVIARSIPTMSAILKAYQVSEEKNQKARLNSDKDLRDTTF